MSPRIKAAGDPLKKSSAIINDWAIPPGLGCIWYEISIPKLLPSPSNFLNESYSWGVVKYSQLLNI